MLNPKRKSVFWRCKDPSKKRSSFIFQWKEELLLASLPPLPSLLHKGKKRGEEAKPRAAAGCGAERLRFPFGDREASPSPRCFPFGPKSKILYPQRGRSRVLRRGRRLSSSSSSLGSEAASSWASKNAFLLQLKIKRRAAAGFATSPKGKRSLKGSQFLAASFAKRGHKIFDFAFVLQSKNPNQKGKRS